MAKKISIVVTSFNRADMLRLCIEALLAQTAPRDLFEIIIVDNNSTDSTAELAGGYVVQHPGFICYVREPKQGLSHARNAGVGVSQADYIGFIDDDAQADPAWVARAIDIIDAHAPVIFGGPYYPFYTDPKPSWFSDDFEIRIHAPETGWMEDGYIAGANIAFAKDFLLACGGFDPDIGMKGTDLSYGEETALIVKARAQGKKLYYDLDLKILHHVPRYKLSVFYWLISAFQNGFVSSRIWNDAGSLGWAATGKALSTQMQNIWQRLRKNGENDAFLHGLASELRGDFYKLGELTAQENDTHNIPLLPGVRLQIRKNLGGKLWAALKAKFCTPRKS